MTITLDTTTIVSNVILKEELLMLANEVVIEDAGNIIVATDVEGALQEVVTSLVGSKAEVVQSRDGWTVLNSKILNAETPNNVYVDSLNEIIKIDAPSNNATACCGLDRLFLITAFTTGNGIKSANFTTLQASGVWNDFTLYLLQKISDTTYSIAYSQIVSVLDGSVNFEDIKTTEELYIGWKANVQYDNTVTGTTGNAFGNISSIANNVLTVTTTGTFNPICKIVLYGTPKVSALQQNVAVLNNTRLNKSEVLLNWNTVSSSYTDGVRVFIINKPVILGLKSAIFYTAQVGGTYKDFKLYLLEKISETQFNVLYYKKYTVTNGIVVIDDIDSINLAILGKTTYVGFIGNTIYTSTALGQEFYPMTLVNNLTATGAISPTKANFNATIESYIASDVVLPYQGKSLSILGDSISSYQGYIPVANAYYFPNTYITDG